MREIDNTEDIIDSRDIIERMDELKAASEEEATEWDQVELGLLTMLAEEASGFDDWEDGLQLIRDSYFVTYAQQLADDIGAVVGEGWPTYCIDWEWAARELRTDYSAVNFAGVTYWVR